MSPSYPHQKTSKDSPKSYQIYNPVQLFPIPFPPLDPLVIPTGLPPPEIPAKGVKREISTDDGIFEWLDKQKTRSVVFVGFASECKLSNEQKFKRAQIIKEHGAKI
ncbi:hypothetical protein ACFX13_000770 [Malus domestica]